MGDTQVDGRAIDFGAQIADFVTMKLTGIACNLGQSRHTPLQGCKDLAPGAHAAARDVGTILATPRDVSR